MGTVRKQTSTVGAFVSVVVALALASCASVAPTVPTHVGLVTAEVLNDEPAPTHYTAVIDDAVVQPSDDDFAVLLDWDYEGDRAVGFQTEVSTDEGLVWLSADMSVSDPEGALTSLATHANSEVFGLQGDEVQFRTRAVLSPTEVSDWATVSLAAPESKAASTPVSLDCTSAMEAAVSMLNSANDSYIATTLEACSSGNEWMAALEVYPLVMGAYDTTGQELEIVCTKWPSSRTCLNQ